MSRRGLARHAARRDANEGEIRKRFTSHGWHTEQVSGKGLPDLLCMKSVRHFGQTRATPTVILVDVKTPKGTLKPAQVKKWTDLHALGIPVYVVRTEADVDALVGGTLDPWKKPAVTIPTVRVLPRKGDAAKAREEGRKRLDKESTIRTPLGPRVRKPNPHYTPPRSTPVAHRSDCEQVYHRDTREPCTCGALDAAKEAEETFATPNQGMMCSNPYPCRCRLPHPWEKEAEATFAAPAGVCITSGRCAVGGCWGERAFGPYCGTHRGMGDPD